MKDEDIDARLRLFRPVSPPDDLRDRVLGRAQGGGSRIGWELAAAAALLAVGLGLNQLSNRITHRIAVDLAPVRAGDERRLAALAESLGGGAAGRAAAEAWIELDAQQSAALEEMP
jgi:hypothetical protein